MPKPEEIVYVCPTHGKSVQIRYDVATIFRCAACGTVMQPENPPSKA